MSESSEAFEHLLNIQEGQREEILAQLAAVAPSLTVDDAIALNFWRHKVDRSGIRDNYYEAGLGKGTLKLKMTASAAKVAISWIEYDDIWARYWIDGIELPVPVDDEGHSLAPAYESKWCGERFYFISIVAHNHPLMDWGSNASGTGNQRSAMIWDTKKQQAIYAEPDESQLWKSPWMDVIDESIIHLYASEVDKTLPVARVIEI